MNKTETESQNLPLAEVDKYSFTRGNMPLVYETAQRMLAPTDERIAISLPLTWETLYVVDAMKDRAHNLIVIPQSSGEHSSIQPGVFEYLTRWDIPHYGSAEEEDRIAVLRQSPDVIVDCSFVLGDAAVRND
ncbi:hypothetical protein COV58_02675 [Candidatus Roizmanbacteria bacterium CG11_big_fil_rev_8_21_14_0_20_36_8]|uniref:Uncharacterized protein n=1 Tax=Candidatus Roizmanbacteria bacterium CG11_big_fil_rev_8_21_14_0_20_36_8 TaxID=1974856 RepID=A0A2M6IU10_9BACT|nr:MAG: hypothetical protein COV58_02675 [Candidatus Roizmanbacteria bacterium CG11_big_fil_rev_8_21_14_0_20_36_8]